MKGFTLIELMIVVCIIGLVTVLTIPVLKGLDGDVQTRYTEEQRYYEAGKIYCIGNFEAVATNSKPYWSNYKTAWTYPMLNSELEEDWYAANVIRECN